MNKAVITDDQLINYVKDLSEELERVKELEAKVSFSISGKTQDVKEKYERYIKSLNKELDKIKPIQEAVVDLINKISINEGKTNPAAKNSVNDQANISIENDSKKLKQDKDSLLEKVKCIDIEKNPNLNPMKQQLDILEKPNPTFQDLENIKHQENQIKKQELLNKSKHATVKHLQPIANVPVEKFQKTKEALTTNLIYYSRWGQKFVKAKQNEDEYEKLKAAREHSTPQDQLKVDLKLGKLEKKSKRLNKKYAKTEDFIVKMGVTPEELEESKKKWLADNLRPKTR